MNRRSLVAVGSAAAVLVAVAATQVGADEASLSPPEVEAGEAVTVVGDECPSGPIHVTIAPEGGDPIADDELMATADDAGAWSFEIDTTDLAPGTYTVAARCVLADLQGYDYDVLSFTVTQPTQPTPTTEPAPPEEPAPQPVPAAPTYTG